VFRALLKISNQISKALAKKDQVGETQHIVIIKSTLLVASIFLFGAGMVDVTASNKLPSREKIAC
jgi:hypothetical protein